MDRGEGQQWNKAPGNLYSTPREITIEPASGSRSPSSSTRSSRPSPSRATTKYIKHEQIQSERLTKFWGRPMHLGAHVLLPEGFDDHPEARYPLVIFHGHFPQTFGGFREEPPDPNLKPEYSERFHLDGYNRIVQELAHQFYKEWTGPNYPRMVIIEIQHANPYYDDSYAVNSGQPRPLRRRHHLRADPVPREEVPMPRRRLGAVPLRRLDRRLGGPGRPGLLPRRVQRLLRRLPRPDRLPRLHRGRPLQGQERLLRRRPVAQGRPARDAQLPGAHQHRPLEDINRHELVLGTKSRSGQQWDIWEAVYSPVGPDGYPKRIWDKQTGVIDQEVAKYWREHYDLCAHPRARLAEDRQEARGQDPHLCRRHGQLLPEQRRLPDGRLPQEDQGPALRRRGAPTAIGPSTAGTATRPGPTPSAASAITRCTRPRSSSGS